MLMYPTVDLPPSSFGTYENPYSDILVDETTSSPGSATILMAYFTREGDTLKPVGNVNFEEIKLDSSPFD
jgi:hypothetical protein